MSQNYKLTIGLLSYNRPDELFRAICSLLPIPERVEILICDDKSPKLDEILTSISDLLFNENIRFISNEVNLGYDRNLYKVIELASSEYVMLLGDDDYLEDGAIQNVLDFVSEKSDFHCGFLRFRNNIHSLEDVKYSRFYDSQKYFDKNIFKKDGSFIYSGILFSGLVFSKKSIEENHLNFSSYYESIYIQVAIFVKLSVKFGSYYINGPGIVIGADGESGFGYNEASRNIDLDLQDRSSVISNLSYHKRLFDVINKLENDTNLNITQPFIKEYKIRSIKALYLARMYGRKYTFSYLKELKKLKIPGIWLIFPIYVFIFLMPMWVLNYPIIVIEKAFNYYRKQNSKKFTINDK